MMFVISVIKVCNSNRFFNFWMVNVCVVMLRMISLIIIVEVLLLNSNFMFLRILVMMLFDFVCGVLVICCVLKECVLLG